MSKKGSHSVNEANDCKPGRFTPERQRDSTVRHWHRWPNRKREPEDISTIIAIGQYDRPRHSVCLSRIGTQRGCLSSRRRSHTCLSSQTWAYEQRISSIINEHPYMRQLPVVVKVRSRQPEERSATTKWDRKRKNFRHAIDTYVSFR